MHVAPRKRVNFSCEKTREKVEEERCMQSGAADLEGNRSWTINFHADAGGATTSHEGQRRPGVTFEHVDYNCDLCQRLCSFLSLSLSLCYLFLLSCSNARERDLFLLIPLPLLTRCFASSTSLLLYQREFRRQCPMIEYALGCYYGVLPNFEGVCGHWRLTCFERKIEWSLEPAESKQLPYRPAIRTQYQLNKTTLHKFA